jgi:hypothetical protein
MQKKYGGKVPMQSKKLRAAIESTNAEKYGGWFVGSKEGRKASNKTMMERHGVTNASNVSGAREKKEATCMETHGVVNPSQSDSVKGKKRITTRSNYGVDNPMQSKVVRKRSEATNVERYGFRSHVQNPEQWKKIIAGMYRTKELVVGKRTLLLQGYEPQAIEWLQDNEIPSRYIRACDQSFDYEDRVYHPDFILKSRKATIYVEVKSTYTAGIGKHAKCKAMARGLRQKSRAVLDADCKILTIVMADDGEALYAVLGEAKMASLLSSCPYGVLEQVRNILA